MLNPTHNTAQIFTNPETQRSILAFTMNPNTAGSATFVAPAIFSVQNILKLRDLTHPTLSSQVLKSCVPDILFSSTFEVSLIRTAISALETLEGRIGTPSAGSTIDDLYRVQETSQDFATNRKTFPPTGPTEVEKRALIQFMKLFQEWGYRVRHLVKDPSANVEHSAFELRLHKQDSDLYADITPYTDPLFRSLQQTSANTHTYESDYLPKFRSLQSDISKENAQKQSRVVNFLSDFLHLPAIRDLLQKLADLSVNVSSSWVMFAIVIAANQILELAAGRFSNAWKLRNVFVHSYDQLDTQFHSSESDDQSTSSQPDETSESKIGSVWDTARGSKRLYRRLWILDEWARRVARQTSSREPGIDNEFKKALINLQHRPHSSKLTEELKALGEMLIHVQETKAADSGFSDLVKRVAGAWSQHRRVSSSKDDILEWYKLAIYLGDIMLDKQTELSLQNTADLLAGKMPVDVGAENMTVDVRMIKSNFIRRVDAVKEAMLKMLEKNTEQTQKVFSTSMKALANVPIISLKRRNKEAVVALELSLVDFAGLVIRLSGDKYLPVRELWPERLTAAWKTAYGIVDKDFKVILAWRTIVQTLIGQAQGSNFTSFNTDSIVTLLNVD
jgi:uncharacterized membrane protein